MRARIIAVILLLLSVTLLVMARSHNPKLAMARGRLLDWLRPAVESIHTPVRATHTIISEKQNLLNAHEENKKLRAENDALRRWQSVAQALKAENDALRALAGYQPLEEARYITARVVGQSSSGYSSSLMINGGRHQDIQEMQPVIDAHGMIGRILELGNDSSRVLLLSDSSSRVPVVTVDSRIHAILAGTGSGDEIMRLTFLSGDPERVAVGEQIATTEIGGLVPGGLLIGTVFKRDATGLYVKPLRPLTGSEYVRVIAVRPPESAPAISATP